MTYPDFLDTFQYANTDNITNLVSPTGHVWSGSGVSQPCIRTNRLTSAHPAAWSAVHTYAQYENALGSDGNVYSSKNAGNLNHNPVGDGGVNWLGTSGDYAYVDVLGCPAYQYVDVEWATTGGEVVLISSRLDNSLTWMTHLLFGNTSVDIMRRGLGDSGPTSDLVVTYSTPITLGVTYRIGVYFDGPKLGLQLPDGTIYKFCSDNYAQLYGRYLCYQCAGGGVAGTPDGVWVHTAGCFLQTRRST